MSSFAKATLIFSAKITELDIFLTRTVNILTANESVNDNLFIISI